MSLRLQLLFAALPLALALVLVGVVSARTVDTLGATSGRILRDNYRSTLAAQRMKESIERMDSAALFQVLGAREKAEAQAQEHRAAFEAELQTQEGNITEPGEAEMTTRLRGVWTDYLAQYEPLSRSPTGAAYFAELEPRFVEVKNAADEILALNQDEDGAQERCRARDRRARGDGRHVVLDRRARARHRRLVVARVADPATARQPQPRRAGAGGQAAVRAARVRGRSGLRIRRWRALVPAARVTALRRGGRSDGRDRHPAERHAYAQIRRAATT